MTAIVSPQHFASKAKLQAALNAGDCAIRIPTPWDDKLLDPLSDEDCPLGWSEVVTNHPLRTKFAKITRTAKGWKVE